MFLWRSLTLSRRLSMTCFRAVTSGGMEQSSYVRRSSRTRSAAKCHRVIASESALANIDILSRIAAFLNAIELCLVKATCKALGSKDQAAFNGLSMTEEAARRMYEDPATSL